MMLGHCPSTLALGAWPPRRQGRVWPVGCGIPIDRAHVAFVADDLADDVEIEELNKDWSIFIIITTPPLACDLGGALSEKSPRV